jgi:glycosyltransferase involved in cell wall biosynthesis
MAFPSSYEGFGMVLVEAMSQRLPVVATPVGAAATFVRDDDTGLLVPPRDSVALATALGRILDDPSLRARLAEAAFRRVRELTWTRTAAQTLAVYQHARDARHAALAHA